MNKKILVISKTPIITNYIKEELESKNFNIVSTKNETLGLVKLRNDHIDLVVLDYDISSIGKFDFLEEKSKLDTTKNIPLIMIYFKKDQLRRSTILKLAKYKINRILQKPLNIDLLLNSIEIIFNTKFDIDLNPCLVDINFDNDIFFIRVSIGLNKDKISLIKYKILEIKKEYDIKINKIYVIIHDIYKGNHNFNLLHILMKNIIESTKIILPNIFVFTNNDLIKYYFMNNSKFNQIAVINDINKALEKMKYTSNMNNFFTSLNEKSNNNFINSKLFNKNNNEIFKLNFSYEK